MTESLLLGLASIIALGIAAQWLSWRLQFPAILLLLIFGLMAGPVLGLVKPDELFGESLFPLVSISVAIILFEGGLSLKIDELRRVGHIVRNLTTIGIVITWILAGLAAHYIVGLEFWPSILVGAILVVTGPTVIIPLLRQVRPIGNVGPIVKWEGIVNDPFGAILAVLVFESIVSSGTHAGLSQVIISAAQALVLGSIIGLAGAGLMVLLLRHYLIPDFLQSPVSLMIVVLTHTVANAIQHESGLLAVTLMGIALANQPFVSIKHITEFKENLRVILISSLFIILASRLTIDQLMLFKAKHWLFVALLILLIRPIAVFFSTIKPPLKLNERLFLAWMAPRGIVAAAVSSVFGARLAEMGFQDSEKIVPLVFQVIIGTVVVYGLTAIPLARLLKVSQANPQGILFIGAQNWALDIARILKEESFRVALVDSNWSNVATARKSGCRAYYGNALAEDLLYDLQLDGIGRLLAITSNDEVNALTTLHFADLFERNNVFQLPPETGHSSSKSGGIAPHLRGRLLFDEKATYDYLTSRFEKGAVVKKIAITEKFGYNDFVSKYGDSHLPLIIITESKNLKIFTIDNKPTPRPGQLLISIMDPAEFDE